MDLLLAAFVISVGIICFISFLYNYNCWKKSRGDRARISFKRFYELYSKESWRWALYGDCIRFSSYPFEYFIEFESYLDVLKYKWFRKKVTKEKQKEKQESSQKDLEKELDKIYEEVKEYGKP
jgi:predicted HTH transcriptional regulator